MSLLWSKVICVEWRGVDIGQWSLCQMGSNIWIGRRSVSVICQPYRFKVDAVPRIILLLTYC